MIRRTVILPIRDNGGRSLTAELAECERELIAVAGGFTKSATMGAWRDALTGRVYRDRGRQYVTAIDAGTDAELRALLPTWCARLRQLALYTDAAAVAVEFIEPEA